ncbi:hypothetical protein [Treponema sp.]|uniref:hypothetical protein n=1 Tax=Treponema sp. TaxID=166 RepID=UPI0025E8333A|nr:hypothetical protein [Treponema sp.]MCR5217132.1 hypothetical protein [Treponema sp.]
MKKIALLTATLICTAGLFAQTADEEEKIILPELTTTVTGDSLTAGKDAVPDFSDVLPSESEDLPMPKLPGIQTGNVYDEPEADFSSASDKQIFANGLIGAGIPGYFTGDFSIYKSSGDNPFSLKFSHENQNGYGKHDVTEGYFDRRTLLSGEKTITTKNFVFDFSAAYDNSAYGLQEKSEAFYDINYQTVSTKDNIKWKLPYGFAFNLGGQAEWYNRYEGKNKDSVSSLLSQQEDGDVFFLNPVFKAQWENYGFNIAFLSDYQCEFFYNSESTAGSEDTSLISRGEFTLAFGWKNDFLKIAADGGVVVGNEIGGNTALPVFSLDFTGTFKAGSRDLVIEATGGLLSELTKYSDAEKAYLFTASSILPSESTDWFGSLKLSLPIGSKLTLDAGTTFKKTAFGNGSWEADYSQTIGTENLYGLTEKERTILISQAALSFSWKIFTVELEWKNNALHVPSNEYSNVIGGNLDFQSSLANWGFNAGLYETIGEDVDLCPVIKGGAFYKLRDSISLELAVDDVVKLIFRKDRDYGESIYLKRAGSAKILVHFFF